MKFKLLHLQIYMLPQNVEFTKNKVLKLMIPKSYLIVFVCQNPLYYTFETKTDESNTYNFLFTQINKS